MTNATREHRGGGRATAIVRRRRGGRFFLAGAMAVVLAVAGGAGCAAPRARFDDRVQSKSRVVERLVAVEAAWLEPGAGGGAEGAGEVLRLLGRRAAWRHQRAYDGLGTVTRALTPRDGAPLLLALPLPDPGAPDLLYLYAREEVVLPPGDAVATPPVTGRLPVWRLEGGLDAVARATRRLALAAAHASPGATAAALFVVGDLGTRGRAVAAPLTPPAVAIHERLIAERGLRADPAADDAAARGAFPLERLPPLQLLPPGAAPTLRVLLVRWVDAPAGGAKGGRVARADLLLVDPPADSTLATLWRRAVGAALFFLPSHEPVALFFDDGTLTFEASGHLL